MKEMSTRAVPVKTEVVRSLVMISIGQAKVAKLHDKDLLEQVRKLARELRAQQGVREVHAIWFEQWRDAENPKAMAPWTPYGAVVLVEGADRDRVKRIVENLWNVARKVDQEMMEALTLNDW